MLCFLNDPLSFSLDGSAEKVNRLNFFNMMQYFYLSYDGVALFALFTVYFSVKLKSTLDHYIMQKYVLLIADNQIWTAVLWFVGPKLTKISAIK